jgi:hypothetical protein
MLGALAPLLILGPELVIALFLIIVLILPIIAVMLTVEENVFTPEQQACSESWANISFSIFGGIFSVSKSIAGLFGVFFGLTLTTQGNKSAIKCLGY